MHVGRKDWMNNGSIVHLSTCPSVDSFGENKAGSPRVVGSDCRPVSVPRQAVATAIPIVSQGATWSSVSKVIEIP